MNEINLQFYCENKIMPCKIMMIVIMKGTWKGNGYEANLCVVLFSRVAPEAIQLKKNYFLVCNYNFAQNGDTFTNVPYFFM
jgi:hypothetical protein